MLSLHLTQTSEVLLLALLLRHCCIRQQQQHIHTAMSSTEYSEMQVKSC